MYIAPPQVHSSIKSGITAPTTGGPGTTGADAQATVPPIIAVVTPENQPSSLAALISGGLSMGLFLWGWNNVANQLARASMPSSSPADKKMLNQSRWNGVYAASALGGAWYLTPDQYKRWAVVGGLPLASYFLPGLLRGGVFGWWGPKKATVQKQERKRRGQQQRKRRKSQPRQPSMRRPTEQFGYEEDGFPARSRQGFRRPQSFRR